MFQLSLRNALKRMAGRRGRLFVRRLRAGRWPISKAYRNHLRGMRALEIGGPSDMLGYGGPFNIYSCLKSIDNCNYAEETLWRSESVSYRRTFTCEGTELTVPDG